jgi:hypothetical protein
MTEIERLDEASQSHEHLYDHSLVCGCGATLTDTEEQEELLEHYENVYKMAALEQSGRWKMISALRKALNLAPLNPLVCDGTTT